MDGDRPAFGARAHGLGQPVAPR